MKAPGLLPYSGNVTLALLLLLMLCALALTGLAHRKNLQPGLVIVVLAAAASFLPSLPRLQLSPEFILTVVVPPLLYSAAYNTSAFQFKRNLRPILTLGVTLVAVTTVVVGYVAHWLLPGLGLASAFVLAAVVAPPDTVTSVSHGRELGLTHRVQTILIGESLVNDAAALSLFALALGAVAHTHVVSGNPLLLFLYQALVGLIVGTVLASASNLARRQMRQPNLEAAIAFILPFAAYLMAEHLHASGILAVVAAAFVVNINTFYDPKIIQPTTYLTRLKEREFWSVTDTLLEAFVFAYMGLQVRFVLEDLRASGEPFWQTLTVGGLILLSIMALRLIWSLVMFQPFFFRWEVRRGQIGAPLTWQENATIGWTGMRGIITLAAAAGIPLTLPDGTAFPGRAVIQVVAITVTIGTLILQGGTLPLLSRRLKIDLTEDDAQERRELEEAYRIAKEAPGANFPAQRRQLTQALVKGEVEESAAHAVMLRLDLEQAAAHTTEDAEQ